MTEQERKDKSRFVREAVESSGLKYRAIINRLNEDGENVSSSTISGILGQYRRGPKPDRILCKMEIICRDYIAALGKTL